MHEAFDSCWQRLHLEPTNDVRAVKRAYAKCLKQIRPEDDPVGFQALRQARDDALWEVAMGFHEEDQRGDAENDRPGSDLGDGMPFAEDVSTSKLEFDDGSPSFLPHDPDDRSHIALDEGMTGDAPPPHEEFEGAGDEGFASLEEMCAGLEVFLGPWGAWDAARWGLFINQLRESPFEVSRSADYEVLQTLSQAVQDYSSHDEAQLAARSRVLTRLDQEFGWTNNDRVVYDALGDEAADALLFLMRNHDPAHSVARARSYYDVHGFPVLSPENFITYLGRADSVYERYYQTCRDEGRDLVRSWSWPAFLGGPIWFAWRCNDGTESLLGLIYVGALFFLMHGFTHALILQFLIGMVLIAGIHLVGGVYGKKMLIGAMAEVFTEVAEKQLSDAEALKKINITGQGGLKALAEFFWGMFGIGMIGMVIYLVMLG